MGSTYLNWKLAEDNQTDMTAPIVFRDILYHDLSAANYTVTGNQLDKGVFFKADTAGVYTVTTLRQYIANGYATAAATNLQMYLAAYQWSDTPVVEIFSAQRAGDNLNIGLY